ncbi:MAG TPA: hypothetical protein VF370_05050 [Candidatus Cryosericum sp.]
MKKTAFARGVVSMVVAVMIVTVLTGCKTQSGTLNWRRISHSNTPMQPTSPQGLTSN